MIWLCLTMLTQSWFALVYPVCVCQMFPGLKLLLFKTIHCYVPVVLLWLINWLIKNKSLCQEIYINKTLNVEYNQSYIHWPLCTFLYPNVWHTWIMPFKCYLSQDLPLLLCKQTHLNQAVLLIWCCSKDISKLIGPKIISFTPTNRSILATSNQMRCSMCRSRDSALCLPTLTVSGKRCA